MVHLDKCFHGRFSVIQQIGGTGWEDIYIKISTYGFLVFFTSFLLIM